MPKNEDSLSLESVLGLDEVLNEVLSIVGNLGPHIVDEEGLSEVVFIVREWHRLEVKGHQGSALHIADLVAAGSGVGVHVEELGRGSLVLGEIWAVTALVPFLIVVNNMVSLGGEKLSELLVLENSVEDLNLVNGGLSALISDASESGQGEEAEVDLPNECLVEHKESEAGIPDEGAGPSIVGAVESRVDLIQVVSSAHPPFPEVVLEDVVGVVELAWVALSLGGLDAVGSVDGGPVVHVLVIETLGGSEAEVVVPGGGGLSEASHWGSNETSRLLKGMKSWVFT